MREISAIDLFCGAGGLTRGFLDAKVRVCAGIDIDSASEFPYTQNNGVPFVLADIRDVTAPMLFDLWGNASVRLLAGCAPCQPFSSYGRTRKEAQHKDWALLNSFASLIDESKPDLVTMENVPGLENQSVFKDFLRVLSDYSVWHKVVRLETIGVPQTRRRLVVLASRLGPIEFRPQRETTNVRDALSSVSQCYLKNDPLHIWPQLSDVNRLRIQHSKPGGTWRDWPEHLLADCHRRSSGSTYPSVYGRMEWDKPAPTITTQCYAYGSGRFGHPDEDRAISLREAALLQTFPAGYQFVHPGKEVHFRTVGRVIGNAVPVKLGRSIGESLYDHLDSVNAR